MEKLYKNLMLIDDHSLVRNSLKLFLESSGEYKIINESQNGLEGLAYLKKTRPDLVVLDIEMPQLDGISTLRKIKKQWPNLPVLMLSLYSNTELQYKLLEEGASGVLCKNADLNELSFAIEEIFRDGMYVTFEVGKLMLKRRLNNDDDLSERELTMIKLLIDEIKIEDIAKHLNMSKRSAENLRIKIKEKLGVKSSYGIVSYAIKNGIAHLANSN
jgi:DNA-binding NarL/FixJ family response regulator